MTWSSLAFHPRPPPPILEELIVMFVHGGLITDG